MQIHFSVFYLEIFLFILLKLLELCKELKPQAEHKFC
jgi:hypothetical protein